MHFRKAFLLGPAHLSLPGAAALGGVGEVREESVESLRYHDIVPDTLSLSYQNLISDFPGIPFQGSLTPLEPPGEVGQET